MAPRTKETLLSEIAARGLTFDYNAMFAGATALFGNADVAEKAVMAAMRKLVPTVNDEPQTDWAAQFMAVDANAVAIGQLRKAATRVSELLATARRDGSQLSIDIDLLAAADGVVTLKNKTRKNRDTINRAYDKPEGEPSLGAALRDQNVDSLYVKLDGVQHAFPVKYGKADKDSLSGCKFQADGKWVSIGALKSVVNGLFNASKNAGNRDSASQNTWKTVRISAEDGADSIGDLYDDTYPQVADEPEVVAGA